MAIQRSSSRSGDVITIDRESSPALDALVLVWWPAESAKLDELRRTGCPRLVVVQDGVVPPISGDSLEEWVRSGDTASMPDRITTLMARARPFMLKPSLDESGVLRVGTSWTSLSEDEVAMAQLLVDDFGSVVAYGDMAATTAAVEKATSTATVLLRQKVARLRNRVRRVGLDIKVVRRRGYILVAQQGTRAAALGLA